MSHMKLWLISRKMGLLLTYKYKMTVPWATIHYSSMQYIAAITINNDYLIVMFEVVYNYIIGIIFSEALDNLCNYIFLYV